MAELGIGGSAATTAMAVAGNMATSWFNNELAKGNAERAYERQKELMAIQQQYAVDNWNREASYNDPKAQMARLKAAGLNPNLVYGNGAAGLEAPSTAAPTAPAAPKADTIPMSNPVMDAVVAAKGMSEAKKADNESMALEIQNKYLAEKFRTEIDKMIVDMKESGSRIDLNNATKENIAQKTSNLKLEADALTTRLGYEAYDRVISTFESVTNRMAAQNKIDDDTATRQARIFNLMANGRLADANAYVIGLFKDPKKAKAWLKDWAKTIEETWKELSGSDGKDSEGHGTLNPFNKSPKSKVAKAARSFFLGLDDWICSWTGTDPVGVYK